MDKKKLKELKKQKREYENEEEKNVINRFVMTIGIVLIALVLLYLFVGIFITKTITFGNKEEVEETSAIDTSTILASQIFEQNEEEYYVLIYNPEEKVEDLTTYISMFKKDSSRKLYKVDSTKKFNGDYIVTKDSNKNPTSHKDLRIISPTLIKINSKNVVEYYEGFEEVKNVFKQ